MLPKRFALHPPPNNQCRTGRTQGEKKSVVKLHVKKPCFTLQQQKIAKTDHPNNVMTKQLHLLFLSMGYY